MSKPPSRRRARGDYRKLIHLLNQKYRREWERAERLQDDLDRLRDGPAQPRTTHPAQARPLKRCGR